MIIELGHVSLILALLVSIVQVALPLFCAFRPNISWIVLAKPASLAQFLMVGFAFFSLTHAYVTSDFSVLNVVQNSHSAKPLVYRITGVWANHEGSMLLWVLILAAFGFVVSIFGNNLPTVLKARVLSVQAAIALGFYLFILFTSNPFIRVHPAPANGNGMNPLLQDPGVALHPPLLYLGYVGLSVAFSFAIAALIEGRVDAVWARWVRPWIIIAWMCLTIGIGLGSWWAYYELGWGGFWFWDPVENASFMPWLVGTALIHSNSVLEKRNALKAWTILLAIVAFSFSLLGTFLVRSGVLTSVHAFATDPGRGVFILMLLIFIVGGSLILFAFRANTLKSASLFQPISREGGLLLNNLLMATGATVVLVGTLYPLFIDAISYGEEKISVGAPFFNAVFIPLMSPMVFAMSVGPFLAWKRGDIRHVFQVLLVAGIISIIIALGFWHWKLEEGPWGGVGIGLGAWLIFGTLIELFERTKLFRVEFSEVARRFFHMPRSSFGMTLGHLGLAFLIIGVSGAGTWKVESIQIMAPGDSVTVAGYKFLFQGGTTGVRKNYKFTQGRFIVTEHGKLVSILKPEKRYYPVRATTTTEASIHTMLSGDLYAVIGDKKNDGAFVTRLYFNPLVVWIWIGVLTMAFGGIISLTDRKYRIGIPIQKIFKRTHSSNVGLKEV